MFRFESFSALYFILFFILLMFLAYWQMNRRRNKIQQHFGAKNFQFLAAHSSVAKQKWKIFLQTLCLILMVLAYARPQYGKAKKKIKSEGVEFIILLDVSNSMMAEDVKPSRLDLAKKELNRLLDLSGGDRVGLIAFAGSAILLSPMTQDKSALKMYIESLSPESVANQGTEFKKALQEAYEAIKRGGLESNDEISVAKAILVVSDGEDNESGAVEAARKLSEEGVKVFTVAVGTKKGAPIPQRDRFGTLKGYIKDKSGKLVISKTEGSILQQLAKLGGGSFYHLTYGGDTMNRVYDDLLKLQKTTFDESFNMDFSERYQWLLTLAVLVGLVELLLGTRKSESLRWTGRFEAS